MAAFSPRSGNTSAPKALQTFTIDLRKNELVSLSMGEAKRSGRQTLLARLLAVQPHCIYCGGTTPATTVDHMPPITMFALRQRPKGLEFPSCAECNEGGSAAEQVAGMMCRIYSGANEGQHSEEISRIIRTVGNNHPGLLREIYPTGIQRAEFLKERYRYPTNAAAPINASGPLLNAAMRRFAAKQALALHYHIARSVVPMSGGVALRWLTNIEAMNGEIPHDLLAHMGRPETLKQGRFTATEQFQFSHVMTEDKAMTAHFASFRESFAILAFVAIDAAALAEAPEELSFRPGFLKTPAPTNGA